MSIKSLIALLPLCVLAACGGSDSDSSNSTNSGGGGSSVSGYTLSGRMVVASNVDADNDTNDSNTSTTGNNSLASAQTIPNPAIVGGHVNVAGQGSSGSTRTNGDVSDFYTVNLQSGQLITLFIADVAQSNVDLDLYLYDSNGKIIDASVNQGLNESLYNSSNGQYFIEVRAETGSSNYVLSLSQNINGNSDISERGVRLSDDFNVGEFIIELDQNNILSAQSNVNTLSSMGLQTQSFDNTRRMLFTADSTTLQNLSADDTSCDQFAEQRLCEKQKTLLQLKALQQRSDVASVSPNYLLHEYRVPNDNFYDFQWHYKLINVPQAWDATLGSANVIVAVVDSGVLLNHPDLRTELVPGYDFISNSTTAKDGNGIDSNPDDPGNKEGRTGTSNFHGTHVAGTIGAATNNGMGVAGVGWLTRIMPLRVLGRGGSGTEYDAEQAIRFAAGLSNDSGTVPAKRADIINLSLGGSNISTGFATAVAQARARGVVIVAAAGNDGSSTPTYPASLDGVISVSAVNISKKLAYYSNYGNNIDVAAPGGDKTTADLDGDGRADLVASTFGDDSNNSIEYTYYYQQGTSMAAPHVAGVIALMKAVNPNLTPDDVDSLISSGRITDDIGSSGRDNQFGYGLINAYKAVTVAASTSSNGSNSGQTSAAALVVSPTSLNFGSTATSNTLNLYNGGGGSVTVTNLTDDGGDVINVTKQEVDSNGLGSYLVTLNRGSLAAGTYSATIVISSTTNTVRVPIILQVVTQSQTSSGNDAGYHYVLLVDPDSLETVQEARASASNGVYNYRFTGVAAGRYQIIAGTDADNDQLICDSGEACGSYLSLDNPSTIIVNGSMNLADFATGFSVNFLTVNSTDQASPFEGYARLSDGTKQVQQ